MFCHLYKTIIEQNFKGVCNVPTVAMAGERREERILLLAVTLWKTDSARHVYVVFIILSVISVNILKFK